MKSIATLITCHNRKEKTLACLEALFQNTLPEGHSLDVFLVDDGSTDGTDQAIHKRYPQVNIIYSDGNLYWNGGMRVAFNLAMEKGFDYYLWLNDDTFLYSSALQSLINTSNQLTLHEAKSVLVVGSTQDEFSRKISYGGVVRSSKWRPITFELVSTIDLPVKCESMNGNCVLIPNEIAQKVGNLEPRFVHAMGDLDYGLRVSNAGFSLWIMPGFVGTCSINAIAESFNDTRLPLSERFRKILQPKGLPLFPWYIFTRRHAGVFWPLFWMWPYLKVLKTKSIEK